MMQQSIKSTFIILALLISGLTLNAQSLLGQMCRIGLEYQISYSDNWGANRPVILTVEPNSPADKAGLKCGDIVETIDGLTTADMSEQEFKDRLSASNNGGVVVTVSNFAYQNQQRLINPECIATNELNEQLLARAFNMYSLEDECDRLVVYPFTTRAQGKIDWIKYGRFAMGTSAEMTELDQKINTHLMAALQRNGLIQSSSNPDLRVETYYTVSESPYYKERIAKENQLYTQRYDPDRKIFMPLPVLSNTTDRRAARFTLKFGINIFDVHNDEELLWQCEAIEALTELIDLDEYVRMTAPMMLLQFPMIRYAEHPTVRIASHRHNFTGIIYDSNDIGKIKDIVALSPASKVEILPGDRIISIDGRPLSTSKDLSECYVKFLENTLRYRELTNLFTNRQGMKNLRYWKVDDYKNIAKDVNNSKYKAGFAYLFNFRPWINETPRREIEMDVISDGVMRKVYIAPTMEDNSYFCLE